MLKKIFFKRVYISKSRFCRKRIIFIFASNCRFYRERKNVTKIVYFPKNADFTEKRINCSERKLSFSERV